MSDVMLKIGMYTEDEIFKEIAHSFLGRSMYDAIFDKIHALITENQQLKSDIDKAIEYAKEHIRIDDEYPAYMEMLIEEYEELLEILRSKE